ncbi:MAG: hypothetical protein Kow00124_22020 [Anaerolineae bacterium]
MDCQELVRYLSDYIDRELDEELTAEAREHLATCHNCRVVLDTTQKAILLCRSSEPLQVPAARRERLFTQLQEAFRKRGQ